MKKRLFLVLITMFLWVGIPQESIAQHVHPASPDQSSDFSTFVQRFWSNEQMSKYIDQKIERITATETQKDALRKRYTEWLISREKLIKGEVRQIPQDAAWDQMALEDQVGRIFFHPALNLELASKPVITLTDPRWWSAQTDCDKSPFCFAPGDKRAGMKGAVACKGNEGKGCGRQCKDGATPIQGCSAWCCEGKCGCAGLCEETKPDKPEKP